MTSAELTAHQKFCSQFMSTSSDFNAILIDHGLGSGKTVTAITIAEGLKASYIGNNGHIHEIPGRNKECTITIAVPKSVLENYRDELINNIKSGEINNSEGLRTWTGTCLIYTDASSDHRSGYRQFYTGVTKKDSKGNIIYEDTDAQDLDISEQKKVEYEQSFNKLRDDYSKELSDEKKLKIQEKQNKIKDLIKKNKEKIGSIKIRLNAKITNVYFIVSIETLISRLYDSFSDKATDTLLGLSPWGNLNDDVHKGTTPHPDCFHSKYGVIILDEIHKLIGEGGKNHKALYNIFNLYTRLRDGFPAMRIITLSATPIFDNPSQLGNIINLLRPRIPFPVTKSEFDFYFTKGTRSREQEPKNKNLFRYMLSSYVSYFKGGNPHGYPYRRNHLMVHPISTLQSDIYTKNLSHLSSKKYDDFDPEKKRFGKQLTDLLCILPNIGVVNEIGGVSVEYKSAKELYDKYDKNNKKCLSPQAIDKDFKERSTKLYDIAQLLINNDGNAFVYSNYIARGILPLAFYLISQGYRLLDKGSVITGGEKSFGIYAGEVFKDYNNNYLRLGSLTQQEDYKKSLKDLFNSPDNKDGSKCRFILGSVEEAVTFKNVRNVHICEPWWNDSKEEQIIARPIRYLSHVLLPEDKQYVDVYYHCSVLGSYPQSANIFQTRSMDKFNKLTVDQIAYLVAFNKTKKNILFEQLVKEAAIDNILNAHGNLVRLEETIVYDANKKPKFSTFFDRTTGKSYIDKNSSKDVDTRKIVEVTIINKEKIIKQEDKYASKNYNDIDIMDQLFPNEVEEDDNIRKDIENIREDEVWPAVSYVETTMSSSNALNIVQMSKTHDNQGRLMTSIITKEIIKDFNEHVNKNFDELQAQSILEGEDPEIWALAKKSAENSKAITYLIGQYDLYKMNPDSSEYKKFITYNHNYIWSILPEDIKKTYFSAYATTIQQIETIIHSNDLIRIADEFNGRYGTNINENWIRTKDNFLKGYKGNRPFNMDEINFMFDCIKKVEKKKKI